jgi:membrane fusion protein (multidrug efflux system)
MNARLSGAVVMSRSVVIRSVWAAGLAAFALVTAACGGNESAAAENPIPASVVQLAPENVTTAKMGQMAAGPTVSGQLTAAREATVRAQVGGSIVALPVDRGQSVPAGALVAKIASRDLEASFESSKAAVTSAETALAVARTEHQRTEALVKGGALAARDVEQTRNAVSVAEAQLAAAKARQQSVWQQIDDTSVKAPFAGIVSARPASLGDVVAPGTELVTIIDPSSLRLEALVPSDQIAQVKPGAPVHVSIRGVEGGVVGKVDRVSPSADPVTRQVSIFVSIPNQGGRLIAGLFADGRVHTATREGVVVPLSAVDETGAVPVVTRVKDGKADRVAVELGIRQLDTEQVEITNGVAAGDVLIVGSAKGVAPGTPVNVVQARRQ